MAWKLRATGGGLPMVADINHVREALSLFADPAAGCELMALRSGVHRTLPGTDLDGLCKAAGELPGGSGIYFRVNPVPVGHPRPANNGDILRRRWIYIDVDPVKADGQQDHSATDEEKERTSGVCAAVNDHLAGHGWPEPVVSDSGNGHGIFYLTDLPNDKVTAALLRRLFLCLSTQFSGPDGTIDKSVHNANRLAKLPGTWARKGAPSDDRPHRPCKILTVPGELVPVTMDMLIRATGREPDDKPAPAVRPAVSSSSRDQTAARRFLQTAVTRLALEKPGNRNNALNRTAYTLGGLVGQGLLDRDEVAGILFDAACRIGLDEDPGCGERGIRGTIERGIDSGKAEPWTPIPGVSGPRPVFGGSFSANGQPSKTDVTEIEDSWSVSIDGQVVAEGPPAEFLPRLEQDTHNGRTFSLYTLGGLMESVFPEPRWVIAGILSEGLNILAGKPKMGKSMMAMNIAMTVAAGGMALGNIQTIPGDVLYISLEDRTRRLQSRARKMLRGLKCGTSGNLTLATAWPRQGEGGLEMVEWWMKRSKRPALCIIDVWGKFRPAGNPKANQYTQDYEHMSPLKDLMDKHGCCGLALMHLRKGASEDVVEDVSGTLGIVGAADGMMILQRARNDNEAKVFVTGRDVADTELALRFDPEHLIWTNLGPAEEHVTGKLQLAIIAYLRQLNGSAAFVADIAAHLEETSDKVRRILHRLFDKRIIRHVGNAWAYPGDREPGQDDLGD